MGGPAHALATPQPAAPAPAPPACRIEVRRSDIASHHLPADWGSRFSAPPVPFDLPFTSIKQGQSWVDDLDDFRARQLRRFKTGALLRDLVERLPQDVCLPTNDVISRLQDHGTSLTVTGTSDAIPTTALRNKLYSSALSVDKPAELTEWRDASGLIWANDIAYHEGDGYDSALQPFEIDTGPLTRREIVMLEYLYPDEMLEWRRRDVAVQDSGEAERTRRTGVFMGALGDGAIHALGTFAKISILGGASLVAAPIVAAAIGPSVTAVATPVIGSGAAATFTTGVVTAGISSGIVSGGVGAVDAAVSNAPDLIRRDIGPREYFGRVGQSSWSNARWGALAGASGEVAGKVLGKLAVRFAADVPEAVPPAVSRGSILDEAVIRPQIPPAASPVAEPLATLPTSAPKVIPSWFRRRAQEILMRTQIGLTDADSIVSGTGYSSASSETVAAEVQAETTAGRAASSAKPAAPAAATTAPSNVAPPATAMSAAAQVAKPAAVKTASTAAATGGSAVARVASGSRIGSLGAITRSAWRSLFTPRALAATPRSTIAGSAHPTAGQALVGSSRDQMRRTAQPMINSASAHLLRFLLDASGRFHRQAGLTSHDSLINHPELVQMGHIGSNKLGGQERLMLQGAWENQLNNISIETPHIAGAVIDQQAISIGGIAVDLRTAEFWELIGWLPRGTCAAAPLIVE